jgi:alkylated DNA repair dioxygenase AlkB
MEQFDLLDGPPQAPPGFVYHADFLADDEENQLARKLASLPLAPFDFHGFQGKRRTVSYGWRYAFDGGGLSEGDPIPEFLLPLRDRAARLVGAKLSAFEHLLVTEYSAGAGIGWHKDRSVFGQTIGISLLAPCRLRFRRRSGAGWDRSTVSVQPRSLYLLTGAARSEWEHSIPPLDQLRYSITLRDLAGGPFRE